MPESFAEKQARAREINRRLGNLYPDARCTLDFTNPLQLLVATILAAQCTDERVNQITPALFAKYPTAYDFAQADLAGLEQDIKSTGFYRNKARSIKNCCQSLVEQYEGGVPSSMEELVRLAGIGRKTANVILGNSYGVPGIVVDTHVRRLSGRLGLSARNDPEKIETDLTELVPQEEWTMFSHRLVFHGRTVCLARKPACPSCGLADICPKITT